MSHTFDIRLARNAGFAALLEAPANSLRWKGSGSLSIDAQGVSIAVKRGFMSLLTFGTTRRIAADKLTEVYREGDALRLEFDAPDGPRTVVPFWAGSREAAAEIVRLMPTRHTVELEDSPANSSRRFRPDWRVFASLFLLVAVFVAGAMALRALMPATPALVAAESPWGSIPQAATEQFELPDQESAYTSPDPLVRDPNAVVSIDVTQPFFPDESLPPELRAELPAARDAAPASVPISSNVVGRTSAEIAEWNIFVRNREVQQIASFTNETDELRLAYQDLFGDASEARLRPLEERWWQLTIRVNYSGVGMHIRDLELAISQSWRRALDMRASRRWTDQQVAAEIEFAKLLTSRLQGYLD